MMNSLYLQICHRLHENIIYVYIFQTEGKEKQKHHFIRLIEILGILRKFELRHLEYMLKKMLRTPT